MKNDGLLRRLKGLSRVMERPAGPRIFLESAPDSGAGLVVQWPAGPDAGRVDLADLQLADCTPPEDLRRVVRFCARRKLPVEVWLLSGIWCVPAGVDEVARWLVELAKSAGPAKIWVDSFAMPVGYRRRLRAHLMRSGCEIG